MKKLPRTVLVIAPHPDDETLGCGGTLLKHAQRGDRLHWLIMTAMTRGGGYPDKAIKTRAGQIRKVAARYGMSGVHPLGFPAATLDELPLREVVAKVSAVFKTVAPDCVYVPYRNDVHSDHRVTFDAAAACAKWFRHPSVRSVFAYETASETGFNLDPDSAGFRPQRFVDISEHLEAKIRIARLYAGELGKFPFPRSEAALRALAAVRGSHAGVAAAEAFMVLRDLH